MSMTKDELRRALRAASPGREARDRESLMLCAHITAWEPYRRARVVGGYMPLSREANVVPVLQDALDRGKTLALPRCMAEGRLCFHRVESLDSLRRGAYGLLEPEEDAPVVGAEEINLLLVPLEGISSSGARLGKGGGYYDRLLASCPALTLGAALSWQWTEDIPQEKWDRPLHACAGAEGIRIFR